MDNYLIVMKALKECVWHAINNENEELLQTIRYTRLTTHLNEEAFLQIHCVLLAITADSLCAWHLLRPRELLCKQDRRMLVLWFYWDTIADVTCRADFYLTLRFLLARPTKGP